MVNGDTTLPEIHRHGQRSSIALGEFVEHVIDIIRQMDALLVHGELLVGLTL